MALNQLALTATLSWAMQRTNASPFGVTKEGPDQQTFSLTGINVATWQYLFAQTYVISPALLAPTAPSAVLVAGGSLTVAQPYYYKVTATGGAGVSGETTPSSEVTATPTIGNQTITVSWTASAHAGGYNVYRGTAAGAENTLVAANVAGTSFSDTGTETTTSQAPPTSNTTGYLEFSLLSSTSLVNEAFTLAHALSLYVLPSGGQALIGPGQTNGLSWFLGGTSPTLALPISGVLVWSLPYTAIGQTITAGSQTLRITNQDVTNHTSTVLVIGSPT